MWREIVPFNTYLIDISHKMCKYYEDCIAKIIRFMYSEVLPVIL